ncbi:MAG: MerR family transcriptional regulator [Bacteriovoracaceae bacterium]
MIPNKSNFKFQELTPITGVKPYVIRFWETEFDDICPVTSDSGQKLYGRSDVEAILKIKKLLFEDKLSIPEAKHALKSVVEPEVTPAVLSPSVDHTEIKNCINAALNFVRDIKAKRNW